MSIGVFSPLSIMPSHLLTTEKVITKEKGEELPTARAKAALGRKYVV